MAVLVTRPEPDGTATAAALRSRGFDVLCAPMLQYQALPFRLEPADARFRGVIVTSANALRAIAVHAIRERLIGLPLFAVGERTADAARAGGFSHVTAGDGDAAALRKLIVTTARKDAKAPLLHLAGADLASNLAAELAAGGIAVTTATVYRMAVVDEFPQEVGSAFADQRIEAVLHYSRRSARAYVGALQGAGLEIAGLGLPQVCISDAVAAVLREAGAARVIAADAPQEGAIFDALERALRRRRT